MLARKNITLDQAQERFKQEPCELNARVYRIVALSYWDDYMIEDDTLLKALRSSRDPIAVR